MLLNATGSSMPDLSNQSSIGFATLAFGAKVSTVSGVVFDLIKMLRKFICCSLPAKTAVCVMSFEICVVVKKNIVESGASRDNNSKHSVKTVPKEGKESSCS